VSYPFREKKDFMRDSSLQPDVAPGFTGCEKTRWRCHSEEQQRRRISHGLENTQCEILRCAQDDSFEEFFRSL